MFLDQYSLLTAIGFSSAALCITLLGAWLGSRRDLFLLNWSLGMAFMVAGILLFATLKDRYTASVHLASFETLIVGFGLVYAGAGQFCFARAGWGRVIAVTGCGLVAPALAFATGLSGVAIVVANFSIVAILLLTAWQYWIKRSEFRFAMISNVALYVMTAVSFALCGIMLLAGKQYVLASIPSNWAEDANSIVVIIGLTGIGALSLMLNQSRIARFHRIEALTDPLTGLPNRRALTEQYFTISTRRTAAVLFDLDCFKSVNDVYGHAGGDLVLKRFADIVTDNLRVMDMAARLGGEEFCVIMPNTSQTSAFVLAERIRKQLAAETISLDGSPVRVSVSAGIAVSVDRQRNLAALLQEADEALYLAKSTGRNRVCGSSVRLVA